MIQFARFTWRYAGTAEAALQDVSLRVQPGEFVVVAGPSGSGKSTLATAMCGLLIGRQAGEWTGCVEVAGVDVARAPLHEVSRVIGLVQQNPEALFATATVADELAFGLENHCVAPADIRRRCNEAMDLLRIGHLRDRCLATLSGGEQQRVAVASILATGPRIVVLDEPTASLDAEGAADLFAALERLCGEHNLVVMVIEHRLGQFLSRRARLVLLERGAVVRDEIDAQQSLKALAAPRGAGTRRAGHIAIPAGAVPGPLHAEEPIAVASALTVALGGRVVLDKVEFALRAGEVVAVMGPNGCGKTTLLHCLLGLVRPKAGTVRIGGLEVTGRQVSQMARHVGMVFQNADHQLVADTVWDEAMFACRRLAAVDGGQELACAQLLDRAGLGTRRADHPFRLSWGQKRRLNVISAVLHGPRLLLLDEPLAGQDWASATFLLEVISGIVEARSGGACLLVTHDAQVVHDVATRVIFLAGGRVLVDAPVIPAFVRLRELGYGAYAADGSNAPVGA